MQRRTRLHGMRTAMHPVLCQRGAEQESLQREQQVPARVLLPERFGFSQGKVHQPQGVPLQRGRGGI